MFDLVALRAAIEADPSLLAFAENGEDGRIAEALNLATTTRKGPKALTINGVLGLLDESSIARLSVHPSAAAIRDDIHRGDRDAIGHWAALLAARPDRTDPKSVGTITMSEKDAILQEIQKQEDIPASVAQVLSGDVNAIVTLADVSDALREVRAIKMLASFKKLVWPDHVVYASNEEMTAAGVTDLELHATKARHEGTILGIPLDKRADVIAAVQAVDSSLAQVLADEEAVDKVARDAKAAEVAANDK